MTDWLSREFLAQICIMLALTVGMWMIFVQPRAEELHQLEAEIAKADALEAVDQTALEQTARRVSQLRHQVEDIAAKSALGLDSSALYGTFMELAQQHDVAVQSLQPGGDLNKIDAYASSRRVTLSIQGSYENIAQFMERMATLEGFVRPVNVVFTPRVDAEAGQLAAVQMHIDVLVFHPPAISRGLRQGKDKSGSGPKRNRAASEVSS
ncbi:MAG: hypothetical protein EA377_06165 [Phycisphaerales bacterium]|nr:MAG: hypothetical protein EA377_06165 [Phycisphaerales bacterium]